jgi:hypothetical protein
VVGDGQGVEVLLCGLVDEPFGAEVDVVFGVVACMSVEVDLEL